MLTSGADAMPVGELIESAARVLCCRGYLDPHDVGEWPDELADELNALAELGCCPSCPVPLTPDALADHWLARKEDEYYRALPTWTCDCGAVYKLLADWGGHSEFYKLGDDAALGPLCAGAARPDSDEDCAHDSCGDILFGTGCSPGDLVGTIRKLANGRVTHSDACPACACLFADVMADRASPQQALFSRPGRPPLRRHEAPRRPGDDAAPGAHDGLHPIVRPGQRQVVNLDW
jgi:hypothetical protein